MQNGASVRAADAIRTSRAAAPSINPRSPVERAPTYPAGYHTASGSAVRRLHQRPWLRHRLTRPTLFADDGRLRLVRLSQW
jgi:hypothetical protein